MSVFKRILCAVDFSEPAHAALLKAAALAKQSAAVLTVANVFKWPPAPYALPSGITVGPGFDQKLVGDVEEKLARWQQDAQAAGAPTVTSVSREGTAWKEIVKQAQEGGSDLIVVGTRGHSGIRRTLLGSVAAKVVRHAPCSVLVVHEEDGAEHA